MEVRTCQNCKKQFQIEDDDLAFYSKIKVPPPTWCWECRMIRRMVFRNQRHLFRRKDDASGKEIFSSFPQAASVKVYEHDYWWSDKWDAMAYGRDYDFSRPFFAQFRELFQAVPLCSKSILENINSDYCDQSGWLKNCYLCFDAGFSENSAYSVSGVEWKDCFDVDDSILKQVIACASCGRAYRIIQMEFEFLKKMGLPLPRFCPNCRFFERMKQANPPKFWHRQCQCAGEKSGNGVYANTNLPHPSHKNTEYCSVEFETSYVLEKPEIVYCEACYQAEVV